MFIWRISTRRTQRCAPQLSADGSASPGGEPRGRSSAGGSCYGCAAPCRLVFPRFSVQHKPASQLQSAAAAADPAPPR
ncbi:unnamed protein product [Merluccius merluccius]